MMLFLVHIVIWSALALFKIKKLCCKSNHSTLSSMIIEAAFPWDKFTPHGKIFSVFNCELQSYGASSQEDLPWKDFPPSYWKYWDRSKWSLMTFDLTCVVILTENFDSLQESWDSDTVNRCVHVSCYVIQVLWCKRLGKVFIFTGSNAVFFIPNTNFHLFNLVFSFGECWMEVKKCCVHFFDWI